MTDAERWAKTLEFLPLCRREAKRAARGHFQWQGTDLVQEALLIVYHTLGKPDLKVRHARYITQRIRYGLTDVKRRQGYIKRWVLTALRNEGLDPYTYHLSALSASDRAQLMNRLANVDCPSERPLATLWDALHPARDRLPWRHRLVLWLHLCEGLPQSHVAQALGLSPTRVYQIVTETVDFLRDYYRHHPDQIPYSA